MVLNRRDRKLQCKDEFEQRPEGGEGEPSGLRAQQVQTASGGGILDMFKNSKEVSVAETELRRQR